MSKHELATAFEHVHLPYGDDGKRVRGVVARCGGRDCTSAIPLPVNAVAGTNGDDAEVEWRFISRKLEHKGWHIGRRAQDHRCPRCQKNAKLAAATALPKNAMTDKLKLVKDTMTGTPPMTNIGPVKTEITREMTRDDRRIIFAKLEEIYVDDSTGYADGWSDEKVAANLGVPRAWVRVIRDENFGDEITSENIRERVKEAHELLAKIKALMPHIEEARKLMSIADTMERELAQIVKVMK